MSFLRNYLDYACGNEAPEIYHVFSAFSAMSSVVSRKIWINQGYYIHYPNLYVVLVSGPGGGKSSALDISKNFIRSLKTIPMSADVTTPQGLMRELSGGDRPKGDVNPYKKNFKRQDTGEIVEYTPVCIFAGELINFLSMDPHNWVNFLTNIYHEEVHEVKTKNKGDDLILGPYINVLACLTTESTANMLHQKIISSGFARRTLFIWGTGRGKPVAFPTISDEQKAAMVKCREWAASRMSPRFNGEIQWTQEAKDWYEHWYVDLRTNLERYATPITKGYYESKHVQLMKLGMLVSISESDSLVMELNHLKVALHYLEIAEKDLEKVFTGSGRNVSAGIAQKVIQMLLDMKEPITLKRLQALMFHDCDREELEKILNHLLDTKQLVKGQLTIEGRVMPLMIGTPAQMEAYVKAREIRLETDGPPPPEPQP